MLLLPGLALRSCIFDKTPIGLDATELAKYDRLQGMMQSDVPNWKLQVQEANTFCSKEFKNPIQFF